MVIFRFLTFYFGQAIELMSSAESLRGIDLVGMNCSIVSVSLLTSSLLYFIIFKKINLRYSILRKDLSTYS